MKKFIQAEVSAEIHARFENHPLHRGKTQREFAGEALVQFLETPQVKLAEIEDQNRRLTERLEWISRQLQRQGAIERRLKDLEGQAHETHTPSSKAS